MKPHDLSAVAAAAAVRSGELTSEALVRDCLDLIAEREGSVAAWTFVDPDYALEQARRADAVRNQGGRVGPLNGVPIGIKDIIDTTDMPTENGTILHAGRQPEADATVVALLREAGAVILGKTVTTELAVYTPGRTRNPHDADRTPGGSSSGSAAAVAARMVPLALGTQTNGSLIRPASYCGVYGYKPSYGRVSRVGVLHQSSALDQVGLMARGLQDAALLAEQLMVFDAQDKDMRPRARPNLMKSLFRPQKAVPRLAFARTPIWEMADDSAKTDLLGFVESLADAVTEIELPQSFTEALTVHKIIMESDLADAYGDLYQRGKSQLSDALREMIERGQAYTAGEYLHAHARAGDLKLELPAIFDKFDALLAPATTGEAPIGLDYTGSPAFCTTWTLCGTPALSLPLLTGSEGMPFGVQLIGRKNEDAKLFSTAAWLVDKVESDGRST